MLDSVKKSIIEASASNETFHERYVSHMVKIQDMAVDLELDTLVKFNPNLDISSIDKLLSTVSKELSELQFQIVTYIADLEVATYEKFPDVADIKRKLMFLKSRISSTIREDENLQKAFEKFEDCINSDNIELYSKIEKPHEVISL